jgi:hypothetical protein
VCVFEDRVVRRIRGPMREEVAGGRRRQHNEQLHNLYASKIRGPFEKFVDWRECAAVRHNSGAQPPVHKLLKRPS